MHSRRRLIPYIGLALGLLVTGACSDDDEIDSNEEARRAYLGLNASIEKALNLGFVGYNTANSANIDPQATAGVATGSLTITGQVDQSASDNKGMRLRVGMVDYSDGPVVVVVDEEELEVDLTYDTTEVTANQPYLQLSLRDFPNGTLTGSLTGVYLLHGAIEGDVTLDLMMTGTTVDGGNQTIVRPPGSTHVTGSATSGDGRYMVDVQI